MLREQGAQSARIATLEADIHDIQKKLDKVVEFVNETKGGYRYLWAVLSLASTVGAVVGSAATYLKLH